MAPSKEFANNSGSDDENSSSDSSSSGSGSDSKSDAGSVHSRHSDASGKSNHSASSAKSHRSAASGRSNRSAASGRSNHSAASGRSNHSAASGRSNGSAASGGSHHSAASGASHHSAASRQSRGSAASGSHHSAKSAGSRRSSHSPSSSDGEEGNLILDERKSRSRSQSRNSTRSGSSKSRNSDGEKSRKSSPEVTEPNKGKRKRLISQSDDSNSGSEAKGKSGNASPTAEALFGEAGDISSDEDNEDASKKKEDKDGSDRESVASGEKSRSPDHQENEKEKEPEEVVPETKIEHEIPYIRADVGKEFHFVKLPNFLSVEPRPYDAETYEDEIDEEETLDEEGRARLKLKVENTIRWRTAFDKDGNSFKESNARMVKWSDGSLSLYLGGEVFDVYRQPLQGDHNHLFIRQGTGLQGQAVFRTKLTFRPHSTDSFTHRKMTLSLADRSQKTSAIKILGTVGKDPDAHRGEMIKKEEEKLRASVRRESKQKRIRERTTTGRGMSGGYLEPDRDGYDDSEDEGAISLSAIKNKYKRGGSAREVRPPIYSSDEDASDIEDRKAKKLERAKALQDSDEEEEDVASGSGNKVRVVSSSEEDSD